LPPLATPPLLAGAAAPVGRRRRQDATTLHVADPPMPMPETALPAANRSRTSISSERYALLDRFVACYSEVFSRPDPLAEANCRPSYKEYVPRYYSGMYGPGVSGVGGRHLKWLRRLAPLLSLPEGTRILDYGGGYGMDSIFLAACGYELRFFEITPHHIGVCEYLRSEWEQRWGPISIRPVLAAGAGSAAERRHANADAIGPVDVVLLDEVAHHIEPVSQLFELSADVLAPGGSLYLLEPNYWSVASQVYFLKVRGFNTVGTQTDDETGETYTYGNERLRSRARWAYLARQSGFRLRETAYVISFRLGSRGDAEAAWRLRSEQAPWIQSVMAQHLTMRLEKA
jgi:SAM-dependent methyltransferase